MLRSSKKVIYFILIRVSELKIRPAQLRTEEKCARFVRKTFLGVVASISKWPYSSDSSINTRILDIKKQNDCT